LCKADQLNIFILRVLADLSFHFLARLSLALTVQFQKLGGVISRSLKELHLADTDVTHGVDALNLTADGFAHGVVDQLLDEFLELDGGSFLAHDGNHTLTDLLNLRALGIGELGNLVGSGLGETDAEETDLVTILGLHINVGLDESLPLLNQRLKLVGGVGKTIEVGEAVLSLDLIDLEFDVGVAVLLVLLQISQVDGNYSSLQVVGGDVCGKDRDKRSFGLHEDQEETYCFRRFCSRG